MQKRVDFITQTVSHVKAIAGNAKITLSTSLFFAALLSLAFNPFAFSYVIGTLSFDRIMGNATLYGIDAELRIQLFQIFNFVFIPVCLIVGVLFCYLFTSKVHRNESDENLSKALSFLNSSSICALALSVIFIFNKYNISIDLGVKGAISYLLQQYSILALPLVIAIATLIYIKRPFVKFEVFRLGIFVSIGLTLYVNFIFQSNSGSSILLSIMRFYIIFTIVMMAILLILKSLNFSDAERLKLSFVPLSFGMLFAGFSLEAFNILNQHEIFVVNRLGGAKIVFTFFLLLSLLLFTLANKKFLLKVKAFSHWETISIIGLLLSLYYFTAIPPLHIDAGTELFEQANHGMLANDFLAWGKFPMVNSFDSHTLSYSLGCIVYGVLNGDLLGASYFGYSFVWLLPTVICMFLVYKNVFDKSFAFFYMLIAPQVSTLSINMGVISIIALLYAVKKRTFGAYLWLFFSVAIGLIYSIPTGFAYGGAAIIVMAAFLIVEAVRKRKFAPDSKAFIKSLGIFAAVMLILYAGICLQQQVNPIKRALEFLGITQSTNNWTYASLGDQTSLAFGLLYSILPLVVIACLIWLVIHFHNKPICFTSCAFFLVYLINTTRSLQRHTLMENNVGNIISTSILGIALFAAIVLPQQRRAAFVFTGIFIATAIFNIGVLPSAASVASSAITTFNSSSIYYDGATEKVTRVNLLPALDAHKNVINMINTMIPKGETFFDLTGQSMLYALTGREKPVYPNQTVTHLSGEYSQKRIIEEVENYCGTCDFALLQNSGFPGYTLDSLDAFYRYYYVYEYLYENYRPLCESTDSFALWVRKDRYDEFSIKAKKDLFRGTQIKQIDYDYLGLSHTMNIAQIPYVWGQYDKDKSWNNKVVQSYDSSRGELPANIQKTAKYALITIDAPTKGNATLSFQNSRGENVANFDFSLLEGNHRYMIRCSTDWWWNSGIITAFSVDTNVNATLGSVSFLVGD